MVHVEQSLPDEEPERVNVRKRVELVGVFDGVVECPLRGKVNESHPRAWQTLLASFRIPCNSKER